MAELTRFMARFGRTVRIVPVENCLHLKTGATYLGGLASRCCAEGHSLYICFGCGKRNVGRHRNYLMKGDADTVFDDMEPFSRSSEPRYRFPGHISY